MNLFFELEIYCSLLKDSLEKEILEAIRNAPHQQPIPYRYGLERHVRERFLRPGQPLHQLFCDGGITEVSEMSDFFLNLFCLFLKVEE